MACEEPAPNPAIAKEIKETELFYVKLDALDLQDVHKKTRRKSWLKTSSLKKKVYFLDGDHERKKYMSVLPHKISKIERKYLCLEYGPVDKPMFILLDFTNEPSESFDHWEDVLRRMMGNPRRRNTETAVSMRRPSTNMVRHPRAHSALQTSTQTILETQTSEDVFEPACIGEASGSPSPGEASRSSEPACIDEAYGCQSLGGASTGADSGSELSPFGSLKSTCSSDPQPEELECPKYHVSQHQFTDYKEEIIVTKTVPGSKLHVGDMIAVKNAEGSTLMDASRLREHIQTNPEETVMLTVRRGVTITVTDGEEEMVMNIRGPKEKRPNAVDVVMKACSAVTNDESGLAIAEINDIPVAVGTQTDQIVQRLREALLHYREGHFHLIPQSLVTADEADEEVSNDNAGGAVIVQEARPIDLGDSSDAPRKNNSIGNEETDC